ncbi:hypothetical protein BGX30_001211 [Mortierella sp. GBA39]|nr:hypothetical protein BGX30_001211 [Mortierella sp. GBA39]
MISDPPDSLQIQTRGPLITRDIDLLTQLKDKCELLVSMTVETDREDMKRVFAPQAPGIRLRLRALQEIREAGIRTQASISPVLPFTPDFPKTLSGIADYVWIDTLLIGDGMLGKRSARLGMPALFEEHGLTPWTSKQLLKILAFDLKLPLTDPLLNAYNDREGELRNSCLFHDVCILFVVDLLERYLFTQHVAQRSHQFRLCQRFAGQLVHGVLMTFPR